MVVYIVVVRDNNVDERRMRVKRCHRPQSGTALRQLVDRKRRERHVRDQQEDEHNGSAGAMETIRVRDRQRVDQKLKHGQLSDRRVAVSHQGHVGKQHGPGRRAMACSAAHPREDAEDNGEGDADPDGDQKPLHVYPEPDIGSPAIRLSEAG
jgi:hypothetical protein